MSKVHLCRPLWIECDLFQISLSYAHLTGTSEDIKTSSGTQWIDCKYLKSCELTREDKEPQPDPDQLFVSTHSFLKFLNSHIVSAMIIVSKLVLSLSLGLFDSDKFQAYIKTVL